MIVQREDGGDGLWRWERHCKKGNLIDYSNTSKMGTVYLQTYLGGFCCKTLFIRT